MKDIYIKSHSKATEYTFFSSIQAAFFKIHYMLLNETSLDTYKIKIISNSFV